MKIAEPDTTFFWCRASRSPAPGRCELLIYIVFRIRQKGEQRRITNCVGDFGSILGIGWQDKATNLQVPQRADCTIISSTLLKTQLCWVGYVIRMTDHRIHHQLLHGELEDDKRKQGRHENAARTFKR